MFEGEHALEKAPGGKRCALCRDVSLLAAHR